MDIEILSKKDNNLLSRSELDVMVEFAGATPSRKQLREAIGQKAGVDPSLLSIQKSRGEFGRSRLRIEAHAYASKEFYEKFVPLYIRVRDKEKEKSKKKEKSKPAAKSKS